MPQLIVTMKKILMVDRKLSIASASSETARPTLFAFSTTITRGTSIFTQILRQQLAYHLITRIPPTSQRNQIPIENEDNHYN